MMTLTHCIFADDVFIEVKTVGIYKTWKEINDVLVNFLETHNFEFKDDDRSKFNYVSFTNDLTIVSFDSVYDYFIVDKPLKELRRIQEEENNQSAKFKKHLDNVETTTSVSSNKENDELFGFFQKEQDKLDNVRQFRSILDEMAATYEAKNHDYGDSFDKTLNKHGHNVALARMDDKLNRLNTILNSQSKVKDESVEDTLKDLATYAIMTLMWYKNK